MENDKNNDNNNQNDINNNNEKMNENLNEIDNDNNNEIKENNENKEKHSIENKNENNIEKINENNKENNNENDISENINNLEKETENETNIENKIENNNEKINENNNENDISENINNLEKETENETNIENKIENNNEKINENNNENDIPEHINNLEKETKSNNKKIDNNKEIEKIQEINTDKNIKTKQNNKKIKDDILSGSKIKKTDEEIEQIENEKIFNNIKNFSKSSTSLKLKLLSLLNYHSIISKTLNITIPKEYLNFLTKNEQKKFEIYSKINEIISFSNENNSNNDNNNLLDNYLEESDYEKYNISKETDNEIKPIYDFWKFAIKNSNFFEMNEKDEEIFNYIKTIEGKIENESKIFKLIINFQENNQFCENNSITKTYYYNDKLNNIIKVDYEEIKWKSDDLNPTLKKKKFKNKKGDIKIKYVDNPSFFDIFDMKKSNLETDEGECEFLKESFFPNLLEYYMNFHDDSEASDY